jgi:hypothetical protein
MFTELRDGAGHERDHRRVYATRCAPRPHGCVELIITAALALSTVVAVTAVSIGIARADVIGAVSKGDGAPFAIALIIGLLFAAMGSITATVVSHTQD